MGTESRAGHARIRRMRLFEEGVPAFRRAFPGLLEKQFPGWPDLYVCPICPRGFQASATEPKGMLTEDHVPPKSLGGRLTVLVCRACNSEAGHGLEAEMRRAENLADALGGRMPDGHPVRIRFDDTGPRLNVHLASRPGEIDIDASRRGNSESTVEAFFKRADAIRASGSLDWELKMEFNQDKFSVHNVRVGWLKSAYLVAFARFGYRFAYAPALNVVREQIRDSERRLISLSGGVDPAGDPLKNAIGIVTAPEHIKGAIGVKMGRNFVLLPGASSDTEFYPRLFDERSRKGMNDVSMSCENLEWPRWPSYSAERPPSVNGETR